MISYLATITNSVRVSYYNGKRYVTYLGDERSSIVLRSLNQKTVASLGATKIH